jgi:hypothetical protein
LWFKEFFPGIHRHWLKACFPAQFKWVIFSVMDKCFYEVIVL